MKSFARIFALLGAVLLKTGKSQAAAQTDDILRNGRVGEWLTHGLDYAETRFSPIDSINAGNVARLGLAWSFNMDTPRGLEATPLVSGGVMYVTGAWSIVYALDAKTGLPLWKWDPHVDRGYGARSCCDVVNRGVALYRGMVYVGTLDGRLSRARRQERQGAMVAAHTVDQSRSYTITGAPRVVKGKVLIGNWRPTA